MRRFLSLIILLSSVQVSNAIETKSSQAILVDYDSDQVLFEKNADAPMTPSSMTKLLTTYIIFEKLQDGSLKLDDRFEVSEKAWKQGGSKMFLNVGDTVSVEDLIKGIIVLSGNDACITAAEGISGTEETFVEVMNKKAEELDLKETVMKNSNGWPAAGHVMSASDLATLSKALIKNFPQYYPYFKEKSFSYNEIKQMNRNTLLSKMKGVDGLKTGSTDLGGYGITASAHDTSRRVIVVVNGLSTERERIKEAETLLKYGLQHFANLKFQATEEEPFKELPVAYGKRESVKAGFENNKAYTLVKDDIKHSKISIKYQDPIFAPIKKGDKIAELIVEIPNKEVEIMNIVALENVKRHGFFTKIYKNVKSVF